MRRARSECSRATARSSRARPPISRFGRSRRRPSSLTPSALTLALGVSEPAELFNEPAQLRAQPGCECFLELEGGRFLHVGRCGELELHCVHAVRRIAIGAGDVAALEAPVEDPAVARDLIQ